MGSWIPMIASSMLGTLVLLQLTRFNSEATRTMYNRNFESSAYEQLNATAETVEYDLYRIGLGVNDPLQPVFVSAADSDLTFRLDENGDGTYELMRYFLGTTSSAASTDNPNDKALYRTVTVGGATDTISVSVGLVDFRVTYLMIPPNIGNMAIIATPGTQGPDSTEFIRALRVTFEYETPVAYDEEYPRVSLTKAVTPASLAAH